MDSELEKLVKEGILTPVETSEWATPLVPVLKSDGKLRLCGDYKSTVNRYLKEDQYPLPKIEEMFAKLHEGEKFTKLDLSQAYHQFELDEDAGMLLTWSTHKGLFKLNRMPFGLSPASGKFQKHIEQLFQGTDNVINFLDDILITGKNTEQHLKTLRRVLEILREAGLTVRQSKCEFFKDNIEYLGHRISREGLSKTQSKVRAILEAPTPSNVSEVRSFMGMLNFYGKFIPDLATIARPIYNLLKNNAAFRWTKETEVAFNQLKKIIASDSVLTHYNPNLPVTLTTDASDKGISAILSHKMKNGEERPISYASRTLLPAEEHYSTIHKEGLAIYYGVNKFYHYLCGRKFILRTDHKPLTSIFGQHKEIPKMAGNRLQRWAAFLSGFNYEIEYLERKENLVADYFSRAAVGPSENEMTEEKVSYINFTSTTREWPIDNNEIRDMTGKDKTLQKVITCVQAGKWRGREDEQITPYKNRREELAVDNGILLWGHRIVIPTILRKSILEELHVGHFGIVKMKAQARSFLYWPKIDDDIERVTKSCMACLTNRQAPMRSELTSWPLESKPWNRIHIDFLGPLEGKMFLIIVDAFSKWIEIFIMKTITAEVTEQALRETFARYGLPSVIVSDNGPQLVSDRIERFFKKNGIKHLTSPPGNPQSNGAAENALKIFKQKLKTSVADERNKGEKLETLISRFLLSYRTSQHGSTKQTPAKLMFGREIRCRLSLLQEQSSVETLTSSKVTEDMKKAQEKQKRNYGGRKREFGVGEEVMVRDFRTSNQRSWCPVSIIKKIGRTTYLCQLATGNIWKRHANQIIKAQGLQEGPEEPKLGNNITRRYKTVNLPILTSGSSDIALGTSSNDKNIVNEDVEVRAKRNTKIPSKLKDYVVEIN